MSLKEGMNSPTQDVICGAKSAIIGIILEFATHS